MYLWEGKIFSPWTHLFNAFDQAHCCNLLDAWPSSTPLLKELHWLPVKFCCQYKIATLAYRHFEGSFPPYLSSSLRTYELSWSLRSSNEKLLKIPKRNLKSFGQRSFSFMAASLWNSLPATLRNVPTLSQLKSQLKTFLFVKAFLQNLKKGVCEWQLNVAGCIWIGRGGSEGGRERAWEI